MSRRKSSRRERVQSKITGLTYEQIQQQKLEQADLIKKRQEHIKDCACELDITEHKARELLADNSHAVRRKIKKNRIRKKAEATKNRIQEYADQNDITFYEAKAILHPPKPKKKTSKNSSSNDSAKEKPLVLISKRGMRTSGTNRCKRCSKMFTMTWYYAESTKGPVHLCTICKGKVKRKKKPKKVDAMFFASTGGGFESNRRKH